MDGSGNSKSLILHSSSCFCNTMETRKVFSISYILNCNTKHLKHSLHHSLFRRREAATCDEESNFFGTHVKQTWGKKNKAKRVGHNQLASTRSVATGGMRVWTPTFVLDKFFNSFKTG